MKKLLYPLIACVALFFVGWFASANRYHVEKIEYEATIDTLTVKLEAEAGRNVATIRAFEEAINGKSLTYRSANKKNYTIILTEQ